MQLVHVVRATDPGPPRLGALIAGEPVRVVDVDRALAAVIGRSAREVSRDEALACVASYTAANDVTTRDFQNVRGRHFIGKSCDTFCPLGPALVTADEVGDPQGLALRARLSGVEVQSGWTDAMLFAVEIERIGRLRNPVRALRGR